MINKRKLSYVLFLLVNLEYIYGENNTKSISSINWMMWGKPYGCKKGFVAVNYQNNKPVKGACVPTDYDSNQSPHPDVITNIYASVRRLKLLTVDDVGKTFTVDSKFSNTWEDDRIELNLQNNHSRLRLNADIALPKLWLPSAMDFLKVKTDKPTLDPFLYTEILFYNYSGSTAVNIIVESTTTLYCDFQLQRFPFDTQICKAVAIVRDPDRLQIRMQNPDQTLLEPYQACGFDVMTKIHNFTNGAGFDLTIKRLILPYMLQYYLPCISIVLVSFISFIIPLSALPGRVGLIVTQFLTLTNVFIHQIDDSPTKSHVTELGKYIIACLFFVMGTMVEFAIVLYIRQRYDVDGFGNSTFKSKTTAMKKWVKMKSSNKASDVYDEEMKRERNIAEEDTKTLDLAHEASILTKKIDRASLVLFSTSYIIFNLIYTVY